MRVLFKGKGPVTDIIDKNVAKIDVAQDHWVIGYVPGTWDTTNSYCLPRDKYDLVMIEEEA